jgi:hypothetical protein
MVMGTDGTALVREREIVTLSAPPESQRLGHGLVLADQRVVAAGGEDGDGNVLASAVTYDPLAQSFEVIGDFLTEPRTQVGVAVTTRYLAVVGGLDGSGEASATIEIFERSSLEPAAVLTMSTPRADPDVVALGNGQFLVAGGLDADGLPVALIELVTTD